MNHGIYISRLKTNKKYQFQCYEHGGIWQISEIFIFFFGCFIKLNAMGPRLQQPRQLI